MAATLNINFIIIYRARWNCLALLFCWELEVAWVFYSSWRHLLAGVHPDQTKLPSIANRPRP